MTSGILDVKYDLCGKTGQRGRLVARPSGWPAKVVAPGAAGRPRGGPKVRAAGTVAWVKAAGSPRTRSQFCRDWRGLGCRLSIFLCENLGRKLTASIRQALVSGERW